MNTEVPRKVEPKFIDRKKDIARRRVTDLLPAVNNTEVIKKFFSGVGDHLFQPEQSEKISGFIGRIPEHAKLKKEFYIAEPTNERTEYQLEPTVININSETNDTENILFYSDMANLLRLQGGIDNNHDRLFDTETYSWCPPIDLDKLMNFSNYFWFNTGPDVIRIQDLTDINSLLGTSNPINIQGIDLVNNMRIVFTNDIEFLFRNRVFIVSGIGSSFDLLVETSFESFVWDDIIGWDEGPWDGPDPQLLVPRDPDYIIMERGAKDGNEWSTGNRWFHRDDLDDTQLTIALETQAVRPIIEFIKDLELANHGTFGRAPVTVRDDITTDPAQQIIGRLVPLLIDGIKINNNDTILFTNAPALQGLWDIEAWDAENAPDGVWDPFFGVTLSLPAGDITTNIEGGTGFGQLITGGDDFVAAGFVAGMRVQITGTVNQDDFYFIDSVISSTMTFTTPFTGIGGIGLPQPENITIVESGIEYQNRVFLVGGIGSLEGITLTLVTDGQNPTGGPADGDQIKVLLGLIHQNKTYYWSDEENDWLIAQEKLTINQAPLFQLYDTEATKLQDSGKYPLSNFISSKIFGYQINADPRQPLDSILGFPLFFNTFGEITFENYIVTERYNFNSPQEEIIGYYFHRTVGPTITEDFYGNDWYLKEGRSRQFIADTFIASDDDVKEFDLSLAPENEDEVQVFINGIEKTDRKWDFDQNTIQFFDFFPLDDHIRVRYYSTKNLPDNANGNYEIPDNLEGNPDNEEIKFISNSDYFAHFTGIIKAQEGLEGNPNGSNNWRTTSKVLNLGTKILQHRAPMLKTMILGSNQNIDLMRSMRHVDREYTRFRNKFLKKINEFFNDGVHNEAQPASEWVDDAIAAINVGKINEFPFAFSRMGTRPNGEPTYMPSSPSRLGVYPVFVPEIYEDTTFTVSKNVIQMHDGGILLAFNDFRDTVILDFEQNIYNSIPNEYKLEVRPDFDLTDFIETPFRKGDYSQDEFIQLLIPITQRWAINNSLDLFKNTTFDESNLFTYNFNAQGLPGYWRGIYKLYYDTDRPNTHPWELFGFSIKPEWWDGRYGIAPYTSTNTLLWDDMQVGRIAFGARAGINEKYARPTATIPVDGAGNLLDPIALGIATLPGIVDAQADWKIGDHGPIETVFRRSDHWSFTIAQISYLMKPVRFVELGWDPKLQLFRYTNQKHPQWIDTSTEDRKQHSEYFVHGETLADETIYHSDGIQQWITDFVVTNGQDVTTTFGNIIRTVKVSLGHRMAGFINNNTTRILADNFGLIPQEDITVNMYQNPSIREEVYSGVIIERVKLGWSVSGYDILEPSFKIYPSIPTGRKIAVDVGSIRVLLFKDFDNTQIKEIPYNTVFESQQEVFDFLISYGRYLEGQGWIFGGIDQATKQANDWRLSGQQFLFWSLGNWAIGSLIAVSPSSQEVKFSTKQGAILSIEQVINGVYGILSRNGQAIDPNRTFISRFENEICIIPEDEQAIFSIRLVIAENEHVLTFNNRTIFNDLIYDPLFRLRQDRFKLFTSRAGGWRGRIDAPGYLVIDDSLIPNFEKTVNDFRRYFEIEDVVDRPALQDTARRIVGFQPRDYMDDLLLSRDTQFQFHQGFIQLKGTRVVFDRLLRSDISSEEDEVQIFEEWALREGEYGAVQDSTMIELLLKEDDWSAEPQLIEFKGSILANKINNDTDLIIELEDASGFPASGLIRIKDEQILYESKSVNTLNVASNGRGVSGTTAVLHNVGEFVGIIDNKFDDIITIANDDSRWILKPPGDGRAAFPFRNLSAAKRNKNAAYFFRTDNKTSGYPLETEITFHVETIQEMRELFDLQRITLELEDLKVGNTVWVDNVENFYNIGESNEVFNFGFMVYRFTNTELTFSVPQLPLNPGDVTVIKTNINHNFDDDEFVMIVDAAGFSPEINGGFLANQVVSVAGDTFGVPTAGETIVIDDTIITLTGITIEETIEDINSASIPNLLAFEETGSIRLVNIANNSIEVAIGTQNATTSGTGTKHLTGKDIEINSVVVDLNIGTAEVIGGKAATYTNSQTISINGNIVTLSTGIDVDSAVIDITTAAITVSGDLIVAINSNDALKISLVTTNAGSVAVGLVLTEGDTFATGEISATYIKDEDIIIDGTSVTLSTNTSNAIAIGSIGAEQVNNEAIVINEEVVLLPTNTGNAEAIGSIGVEHFSGEDIVINGIIVTLSTGSVGAIVIGTPAASYTDDDQIEINGTLITLSTNTGEATETGSLNATYTNGDDIIINGVTVVLATGTTIDAAVIDIIAASISNITVFNDNNKLKIISAGVNLDLTEGTALLDLGFTAGTFDPKPTVDDAVIDITASPIPNITATNDGGALKISSPNPIILKDITGTPLIDLGILSGGGPSPDTILVRGNVDDAVIDITVAAIPNITASNDGGALKISSAGTPLILAERSETSEPILSTLGLVAGITLVPSTVDDTVIDITNASIANITASNDGGALKIISTGEDLILAEEGAGTALSDLGFIAGTTTVPNSTVDDAVLDIIAEAIPNISAQNDGGALKIISSVGGFTLAEGSGTALFDLGFISGTINVALVDLGFVAGTTTVFSNIGNVISAINAEGIPDIEASGSGSNITITNTASGSVTIAEGTADGILNALGLVAGTFVNQLADVGFVAGTFNTASTDLFAINNPIQSDENEGNIIPDATINIFTESRFADQATRNAIDTIPWTTGEFVYVDTRTNLLDSVPLWTVFQYSGTSPATNVTGDGDWSVAVFDDVNRTQTNKIDVDLFKQTLLYNRDTNITDIRLNIWDPAKGLFPSQILDQIDYRIEYDPAKYTNGDDDRFQIDPLEAWGATQVGQTWWDLSEVEYVNYENGSNRYRRNNWGRIAPGKSIIVYEWVRSTVPPTQWANLVEQNENIPAEGVDYKPSGEAFFGDDDGAPFVQIITTNPITGVEEIRYYFWIKNSESIPNLPAREFSIAEITRQLINPTSAGVPWYAPINKHSIIVSGIENFLTREDSVLQLNYNFTQNQNNLHREWKLSREGDVSDIPTNRFWNKMVDSLVGFDIENSPVPDPNLEQSRRYGNFIRPRQTWFINKASAGRIFIDCVNDQLSKECIIDSRQNIFDNLFVKTNEPIAYIELLPHPLEENRPPCEYDFHVTNNIERDLLLTIPGLNDHDQVWVDGIPETNGFWKVYRNDPVKGFVEVCSEAFRLEDFWRQVDFVEDGFENVIPDIIVDTVAQRDALPSQLEGTIIRVNDSNSDGLNIFALFEFRITTSFTPWFLITKQDCSIEFNTELFFDLEYGNQDIITGLDGRNLAFKALLVALRTNILNDLEENLLFYKMINYVHSEQLLVDWAFKTSYLFVTGFNRAALQDPIATNDATNSFISFINEAKPYHSKLRDFVTNEDFGFDTYEADVKDFDKPVFFDEALDEFRVLDPDNEDDKLLMADADSAQNDWFNNYIVDSNVIRKLNTTILFDRVSCDISGGWDPVSGWDFGPNESWDLISSELVETAADRILRSYKPQPFSIEDVENDNIDKFLDLASLISGCDFRGTIVDGFQFTDGNLNTTAWSNTSTPWSSNPWSTPVGSFIDINNLDTFLDGGGLINPGVILNPSSIIVDGNLFIQPTFDSGHPEELSLATVGEAISICVGTKKTIGAPNIKVRKFSGVSGAGPYNIGQQPASKEAVFVYINGLRVNSDSFTVDVHNNTILFTSPTGDNISAQDFIVITSFSSGGAEGVIDIIYFNGDGITDTYSLGNTPLTPDSVFVTLNGDILTLGLGNDYTIDVDTIIFDSTPTTSDEFFVTIFESNNFTTILSTEYDVVDSIINPITAPAVNIYDIGQNVDVNKITEVDNIFVDINGDRQRPFRPSISDFDFDYTVDFNTNKIIFMNIVIGKSNPTYNPGDQFKINDITVTLNGTTIADAISDINLLPNIEASLDDSGTRIKIINTEGDPISLDDINDTLDGLGFNIGTFHSILKDGDKIIISSMRNDFILIRETYDEITSTFGTVQDLVIPDQVVVKINGNDPIVDPGFTVDILNNEITLSPLLIDSMVLGDLIEILIYYVSTETFDGNSAGPSGVAEYGPFAQTINEPEKVFIYVNGVRERDQIDYNVIDNGTKIRFLQGHTTSDEIIVSIITGRESADPIAFRIFLNNLNSLIGQNIQPLFSTILTSDITAVETLIELDNASGLPPSGTFIIVSGNGVNINYEFIQYNNVTLTTVDVIQRGFDQTIASTHSAGDIIIVLDQTVPQLATWNSFRISNISKAVLTEALEITDTEIKLDRVAGLPKQVVGQQRMITPGVIWIGSERIEFYERQGTTLKQIRRGTQGTSSGIPAVYDISGDFVEDVFTGATLTYPIGTQITDGSKKQAIPGGYRFEVTPFGLQFSNSAQAQFLKAGPGTC